MRSTAPLVSVIGRSAMAGGASLSSDFTVIIFISVIVSVLVTLSLWMLVLLCGCCCNEENEKAKKGKPFARLFRTSNLDIIRAGETKGKTVQSSSGESAESSKSGSKSKDSSLVKTNVRVRWASISTRILTEEEIKRKRDSELANISETEEGLKPIEAQSPKPVLSPTPPPVNVMQQKKSVDEPAMDRPAAVTVDKKQEMMQLMQQQMQQKEAAEQKRRYEEIKLQQEKERERRRGYRELQKRPTTEPVGPVGPVGPVQSKPTTEPATPPRSRPRTSSPGPSTRDHSSTDHSSTMFVPDHATTTTAVFIPVSTLDRPPSPKAVIRTNASTKEPADRKERKRKRSEETRRNADEKARPRAADKPPRSKDDKARRKEPESGRPRSPRPVEMGKQQGHHAAEKARPSTPKDQPPLSTKRQPAAAGPSAPRDHSKQQSQTNPAKRSHLFV